MKIQKSISYSIKSLQSEASGRIEKKKIAESHFLISLKMSEPERERDGEIDREVYNYEER